jgi:hypothetical protein
MIEIHAPNLALALGWVGTRMSGKGKGKFRGP